MLSKCPTGIEGLDNITGGGLPQGRPTLVCGGTGCGKTLLGMEFLVRGIRDFKENGVCVSFEETAQDLIQNVASLGFDLSRLIHTKKLVIDHVNIDRNEIAETGDYDLEGLFIRLGAAIDSVRAQRVVLDTPEALFAGLSDTAILRSELRRLFGWLKKKGVTAVITGERGEGTLTRHGLEEYVSDCVIMLDHRVLDSIVTRRLRVLKYRGSAHGTNEYPFLIDQKGMSVLPVTSLELAHEASPERVPTGIQTLDDMLGGHGFFRGSSILLSGAAGTGKTSVAAHFVEAACQRGEKALYFAFEESPKQLARNMHSIGIDLGRWMRRGLLHIDAARPSTYGLEMHLVKMHQLMEQYRPRVVVVDPISSLLVAGQQYEVRTLVLRMVDYLKQNGATAYFTALASNEEADTTEVGVSSLVDAWLLLRNLEVNGERNRVLYVLKSRGMRHSNQVREFLMTNRGVKLRDVYVGPGGVLTGSARLAQEMQEHATELRTRAEVARRQAELQESLRSLQNQFSALEAERQARERELSALIGEERNRMTAVEDARMDMGRSRSAGPALPNGRGGKL